jgi:hypothetical protein
MPNRLLRDHGFDAEQGEMLGAAFDTVGAAFDTAWQVLSTRDQLLKQQPQMQAARETLAKFIFDEGAKGELRAAMIVHRALARFDRASP